MTAESDKMWKGLVMA